MQLNLNDPLFEIKSAFAGSQGFPKKIKVGKSISDQKFITLMKYLRLIVYDGTEDYLAHVLYISFDFYSCFLRVLKRIQKTNVNQRKLGIFIFQLFPKEMKKKLCNY